MAELHSYTRTLSAQQISQLKADLPAQGFATIVVPHTQFAAAKDKLRVAVYTSGKLLLQGKGIREFVEFYLEPNVLREARLGYETLLDPAILEPRIGVDESGKGDFFGPMVIAGAFVNETVVRAWMDSAAGIRDSKTVTSDGRIAALAKVIRETQGCIFDVVTIGPAAYNQLHKKMGSVNKILAWGHARIIENLLAKLDSSGDGTSCKKAISDQFGDKSLILRALMERGKRVELVQRHKAESDLAVAAASILARDEFVRRLKKLGDHFEVTLPKGASSLVEAAGRKFVAKHGAENLGDVAKLHFRTTQKVCAAR